MTNFTQDINTRLHDNNWDAKISKSVIKKHRRQVLTKTLLGVIGLLMISTATLQVTAPITSNVEQIYSTQFEDMVEGTMFSETVTVWL